MSISMEEAIQKGNEAAERFFANTNYLAQMPRFKVAGMNQAELLFHIFKAGFNRGILAANEKKVKSSIVDPLLDMTSNGVKYDYELAGPRGARFFLYKEEHHTTEDIRKARGILRAERDVVSIRVIKVKE